MYIYYPHLPRHVPKPPSLVLLHQIREIVKASLLESASVAVQLDPPQRLADRRHTEVGHYERANGRSGGCRSPVEYARAVRVESKIDNQRE